MISSVNPNSLPLQAGSQFRDLDLRAQAAAAVAAAHAAAVDRNSAFPAAAFAEIRKQRLLGIMVPRSLGGEGASISDIVDVCYVLGQACASTGMIYAMHQVKMACIVRYINANATLERIVRRIAAEQLLMASSTTEGIAGGNVRASEAPVERSGDEIRLVRQASCISYGVDADGIVTTARRAADAAASDQVLLVFLKSDYELEPTVTWDTLGMRGTASVGFTLRAKGTEGNIVPEPYEKIHVESMVPCAHLMWGAVWAGIAAAAAGRAQAFMRSSARQSLGRLPPGAPHLNSAVTTLRTLVAVLGSSLREYERVLEDEKALHSLEFQSLITLTKVQASELAAEVVLHALRATGLSGYRNDSEFSVARHLRDVLSSPIMINNDRILSNLTSQTLLTGLPTAISG